MRVVSVLTSGVAEAKNGTATLNKRGSSAYAQWFRDFEGQDPAAPGAPVQLDGYGSATIYVNEMADIIVKDVNGQQVRNFVDANAAPTTEVRSKSFTGVDYETGAAAYSNPTTLQAVLDRWYDTNTAHDWKVLVNGEEESITSALASVVGAYCNVKNPDYAGGAIGDGIANDLDAIDAAIADCVSKGGGTVFFPAGTYRVTDSIELSPEVGLLGVNPQVVSVIIDNASNAVLLDIDGLGSSVSPQVVESLRLDSGQANSSPLVRVKNVTPRLVGCVLGGSGNSTGSLLSTDTEINTSYIDLQCIRCDFFPSGPVGLAVESLVTTVSKQRGLFHQCRVFQAADSDDAVAFNYSPALYSECLVDFTLNTSGFPFSAFNMALGGGQVIGCKVIPGLNNCSGIDLPADGASYRVVEAGNEWANNLSTGAVCRPWVSNTSDTLLSEGLRCRWIELTVADSLDIVPEAGRYGVYSIRKTAGGNQNIVLPNSVEGQGFTLIIWNDTGAARTFTWTGSGETSLPTIVVNANEATVVEFICFTVGAVSRRLVQNGVPVSVVP